MTVTTLPTTELTKTRQQILAMVPPLRSEVDLLTVKTEEDYQTASALLTRILASKRWWLQGDPAGKWKGIDAIIKPFREGLDGLYELKNDGLKPHEVMEADVKSKMKDYKLAETKRLADEKEARDAEARRIQQEIDAKQARIDAAKTPKMREKLIGQQMEMQQAQKTVVSTRSAPVKAAGSAARTVKKPVIKDFLPFVMGIIALQDGRDDEEGVPLDLLQVNPVRLAQLWKENPDLVAQLPGVEIENDVVIAGR